MADTLEGALGINYKFIISNDLRTITIPEGVVIGVYNDRNVQVIDFEMPRYYHQIDLSTFAIKVNYIADDEAHTYIVVDKTFDDDIIRFTWVVDTFAFTQNGGTVTFAVCLREINDQSVVTREFNTTVHRLKVLPGLEVSIDEADEDTVRDYIAQIQNIVNNMESTAEQMAQDIADEVIASIPEDYSALTEEVSDLNQAVSDLKQELDYSIFDKLTSYGAWYVPSTGILTASSSWRSYYCSVDDFSIASALLYSNTDSNKAIAFYSGSISDNNYISGIRFDSGTLISSQFRRFTNITIPSGTRYILFSTRTASGANTDVTGSQPGIFGTTLQKVSNLDSNMTQLTANVNTLMPKRNIIQNIYSNIWNANDFVFVGDELWLAKNDTVLANCEIRRYKIINNVITYQSTLLTDFGHWNTVDYCPENDCLIFGNGANDTSTTGNWFAVVPHPRNLSGTVTLENVGIKYNVDIGYKVQAVWGDANLGEYNIAIVFSNNARTIKKYLLKKTDGNFNGQMVEIASGTQDVSVAVGGADYWGDTLYIGDGTFGLTKMSMTDYQTEKIVKKFYNSNGDELNGSVQGIFVDSLYIWVFLNISGAVSPNYLFQLIR